MNLACMKEAGSKLVRNDQDLINCQTNARLIRPVAYSLVFDIRLKVQVQIMAVITHHCALLVKIQRVSVPSIRDM